MILFRRLGNAVRSVEPRDWVLLTLETVAVVAGILIAFELSEWAERRREGARHHRMMERLFEEVQLDVAYLRKYRDGLIEMLDREHAFATALSNGECPANKDFEATTDVIKMPALTIPTAVYEELLGAGGLSSIERKDVRHHLAQFRDTLNWGRGQVEYFRDVRIKPITEDDSRLRIRFDPKAEDPEIMTFDRAALCRDQGFKNRVASATRNHTVFVSYFQETLDDAIKACVRLGDSLGKTCRSPRGGPLKGEDAATAAREMAAMRKELARS